MADVRPQYEVRQQSGKDTFGVWDVKARRFVESGLLEVDALDDADAYNRGEV